MQKLNRNAIRGVWQLTRSYWQSEEKLGAGLLLGVIIALNLGHVYLLVMLNEWYNKFYNTIQNYDKDGFFSSLGEFSLLATVFIIVAVYEIYLQQMLEINWRRWLTGHYIKKWLGKRTYYRMQIMDNTTDNPDQRISEDFKLFVSLTLKLTLGLLKATVTLVSFIAILWNLSGTFTFSLGGQLITIPGYMVWVSIIYAIVGTWITDKIGRPLVGLNYDQQRYEADFRFSLVRLRENSESIAFYRGESQEEATFAGRFKMVYNNFRELMLRQKKLTWLQSGYGQIAIIFPFVFAAPRYFTNQIQLGGLIQISSAFGRVQDALSFFVDSYSSLAEWRAVVNRLTGFNNNMELVQVIPDKDDIVINKSTQPQLIVTDLDIVLPHGEQLIKGINLKLGLGDSLLITGPSGCGKSTLMRTLAGIWPFGRGCITIPTGHTMLFLPQKSYLPLGTLREVLLYPYAGEKYSDERIQDIMMKCKLADFIKRLDEVENWSHILSLGEQQRIAFARAILQQPNWLFLDEATSALDEPTEQLMYQLMREYLANSTIISIGHRNTLTGLHKLKLNIDSTGQWVLG